MQVSNIIRSWKDEAYPQNFSASEQAMLPAEPAGEIELTDVELDTVYGSYDDQEDPNTHQHIWQGQRAVNIRNDDGEVMTSTVPRSDSNKATDSGHPAPLSGLMSGLCGIL